MSEMYEKGIQVRREVLGAEAVERAMAKADEFTLPYQQLTNEYCWGAIWARDGMDRKTRSLLNLAMLTALNRPQELRIHVKAALTNGVKKDQIREVLLQCAVYCGIPAGREAFEIAGEVIAQAEAEAATNKPAFQRRTIAFFGLGRMGIPMAGHLVAAGHEVRGVDLSKAACDDFARSGGKIATAAKAVEGADIVITMLPDGKIVQEALLGGKTPAIKKMKRGTIVIDMSSSSPLDTQVLAPKLKKAGIELVDAPVSGGIGGAKKATLTIMAGGDKKTVARVRPVLELMGTKVFETGISGSGHALKALNNYVSAAGLTAAAEAVIAGEKFGLDPEIITDVINAASGRNFSTETKLKPYILTRSYDHGFALALMAKDVRIADELANHLGFNAPLANRCKDVWAAASKSLGPQADNTAIHKHLNAVVAKPAKKPTKK
jgi:3-hydroxyisobutyrate dehydrogenase